MAVRQNIQNWLRSRGVEVRKAPSAKWPALPVFQLAVDKLMQLRGQKLRFVQVGANDGLFADPIRPYVLNCGWSGVLCEPQPDVFERLRSNYAEHVERLIFKMVAVSSSPESMTLYRAPRSKALVDEAVPYNLTVTSFDKRTVAHQTGFPESELEAISVPTVTLDGLLEKYEFDSLDVLQIDVEGFDFEVMKTISLQKYRPGVIQFEHGHLTLNELSNAVEFLSDHGYLIYYGGNSTDSVAMPSELFAQ